MHCAKLLVARNPRSGKCASFFRLRPLPVTVALDGGPSAFEPHGAEGVLSYERQALLLHSLAPMTGSSPTDTYAGSLGK